ncbi:MAG: sugar ABC transporter permease [Deltaproteobacteria bacterium]|nr:sugar ABC transporter permease [Deltaproteobacteria bacterium]
MQLLVHLFLVVVTLCTLYPVLWVVKMALTPSQAFAVGLSPIPDTVAADNFRSVVGNTAMDGTWVFGHQLLNSVLVSAATALVGLLVSVLAAYAMSRFRFPGRQLSMSSMFLTQMFPGTLMMVPLYAILDRLNLLDQLAGLVVVYATTSVPFSVWLLKGYFDTLPKDLEEAALMDGASRAQILVRIVLPLARPGMAVTGLFSFMTAWNEYILAAKFMSREVSYTLPVVLAQYAGTKSTAWGNFAAGALIVSIPVMALFFALQKHLVGGLTAGAVKG